MKVEELIGRLRSLLQMEQDLRIGRLIIDAEQERDAIHIAVAPVVAAMPIRPGEHVGLAEARASKVRLIGIADPFLNVNIINKGERFWLFLYPGSVTSLRHQWTHPAFPSAPRAVGLTGDSQKWLENFAEENGIDYAKMMSQIAAGDSYMPGLSSGIAVPEELWLRYEIVTGHPAAYKTGYFSCAC
jgi:hypothetical protein